MCHDLSECEKDVIKALRVYSRKYDIKSDVSDSLDINLFLSDALERSLVTPKEIEKITRLVTQKNHLH